MLTKLIKMKFGEVEVGKTVVFERAVYTKSRETIGVRFNGVERFISVNDIVRARRTV